MDTETDKLRGNIPAKLSQLKNDNHTVTDAEYVHTDNNYSDADKAVVGSLPATILTNPHVIASGGETYLNVTYDMAELVDGAYSTTTKTVSIPAANSTTNRAGLLSGPDKIIIDSLPGNIINVFGANTYTADKVTIHYTKADKSPYGGHIKYGDPKPLSLDIPGATSTKAGVMRADDKAKLDGIEEGANNYVLPVASSSVRGGVVLNTEWQAPALDSEDAGDKNVPLEVANESSASGILKPACKVYVDDVPTSGSNHLMTSGAVCTAIDKAKRQVFIDLWNQACYQYGGYKPDEAPDPAKPFLCNKFWFSYEEALEIYNSSNKEWIYEAERLYKGIRLKTVLPVKVPTPDVKASWMFESASVERISFVGPLYDKIINFNGETSVFSNCTRLEVIETQPGVRLALMYGIEANQYIFQNCVKLREVRFFATKKDFDIHWSPLLSLASVQSFVPPSAASKPCTITVHPDVYAKLTGDTTNEAAAALTEEEAAAWQQIVVDAAAMNFSFATV